MPTLRYPLAVCVAVVLFLAVWSLVEIRAMRDDLTTERPVLLQKFSTDGVETMRYEGESLRDALDRHIAAVKAKKRAERE